MAQTPAWDDDDGSCAPEELPTEVTARMPALHQSLLLERLDEDITEVPTARFRVVEDVVVLADGSDCDIPIDVYDEVVEPPRAIERGGARLHGAGATRRRGWIRSHAAAIAFGAALLGLQVLSLLH